MLLVGSRTGSGATAHWTVPSPDQAIVHLDVDPAEVGRNYPMAEPLVCDAALGLRAILNALGPVDSQRPWAGEYLTRDPRREIRSAEPLQPRGAFVDPSDLYAALQQRIDDRTVVVADAGYCALWALDRVRLRAPGRRFLAPHAYGSLGYGVPAAIGAKLADRSASVVCVTGDGGVAYGLAELETAARYGVAVTIIVLNNASLGWSRHYNRHFYGYEGATDLLDVDYAAVARALRCNGVRVDAPDAFADALHDALASDTTNLIDVAVDPEARPPLDMFD